MNIDTLLSALFGDRHQVQRSGDFLAGDASLDGQALRVIGTTEHAPIGVELALAQAREVLDVVRNHPGQTILLLIDTQGQRLRHRDELLAMNRFMAHLGCCIELARRQGH